MGTDHRPLLGYSASRIRVLDSWDGDKLEYEDEVVYKKGSNSTNADALRIHVTEVCTDSRDHNSGLTKEKQAIFQEMHDKPIGGHSGMNRTYRMKILTTLPGMKLELVTTQKELAKRLWWRPTQCYRVAQAGKAHTITENLIKPCVKDIVECMLDGKATDEVRSSFVK